MSISPQRRGPRAALGQWLVRTRRRLAAAFLPQDCFLCGAASGDQLLCKPCTADLPRLPTLRCPTCALPTPQGETCGACLAEPPYFDATMACFSYEFPVDRLIQALKYQHRLLVADFLSHALSHSVSSTEQMGLLLALPLSVQRMRERGFNQAVELARPLAAHLGVPLLIDGYRRTVDTQPQTTLPWKERQKNIQGAFECGTDLTGKHVAVVDDVMTTGATLNEFARTLKKHGAARVTNWVIARALRN